MNRRLRAAAVFLFLLAAALPLAAMPAPERAESPWERAAAALWARIAPVLSVFEKSRSSADPNGAPAPAPEYDPQAFEGDSRSSADPDG